MNRILRGAVGAALGLALAAFLPAPAAAQGGFCSETENFVTCCATDENNHITDCHVVAKPRAAL